MWCIQGFAWTVATTFSCHCAVAAILVCHTVVLRAGARHSIEVFGAAGCGACSILGDGKFTMSVATILVCHAVVLKVSGFSGWSAQGFGLSPGFVHVIVWCTRFGVSAGCDASSAVHFHNRFVVSRCCRRGLWVRALGVLAYHEGSRSGPLKLSGPPVVLHLKVLGYPMVCGCHTVVARFSCVCIAVLKGFGCQVSLSAFCTADCGDVDLTMLSAPFWCLRLLS